MSARTGFDEQMLSNIEKAEVYPQLGTIIKLSKVLDGAFGQLLSGEGDKPYAITRLKDRKTVSRSTSGKGHKHIPLLIRFNGTATNCMNDTNYGLCSSCGFVSFVADLN